MFLLANSQQFKLGIAVTAVSLTECGISLSKYLWYECCKPPVGKTEVQIVGGLCCSIGGLSLLLNST